eukprot:17261-Heterococcus_DN1.PRE.2
MQKSLGKGLGRGYFVKTFDFLIVRFSSALLAQLAASQESKQHKTPQHIFRLVNELSSRIVEVEVCTRTTSISDAL